jgi:hypothetical protein
MEEGKKKGYFIDKEEVVLASQNEIKLQRTIFTELKGVKDRSKKAMLDWMQQKIHEYDLKKYPIPR